jgi:hypothetical protein
MEHDKNVICEGAQPRGNVISKPTDWSLALSKWMVPPWAFTISRHKLSPKPEPMAVLLD